MFWSCNERIPVNHKVCDEHYRGYASNKLDECPSCGRLKEAQYPLCLICKDGKTSESSKGFFGRIADAVEDYVTEAKNPKPNNRSRKPRATTARKKTAATSNTGQASSTAVAKDDDVYYTYVLQFDGDNGRTEYYVGQTNNVRARKREHQMGTGAKTTKGRNPKLVWFSAVRTRAEAESYEAHLTELARRSNGRAITEMIIDFEDLVRELENPNLVRG